MKKQELLSLISDALTVKVKPIRVMSYAGKITLTCSNTAMEVKSFANCDFPDFDVVLDGGTFYNAVRYLIGDDVILSPRISENGKTVGVNLCGEEGNRAVVLAMNEIVHEREKDPFYEQMLIPNFTTMANQVGHCVEKGGEPGRAAVYLGIYDQGVSVTAFNGPALAVRKSAKSVTVSAPPKRTIAVYGSEIQAACKLIGEETPTLFLPPNSDYVRLVNENHEVLVSTLSCQPPATHKLLAIPQIVTATVNRGALCSALNLCEAFGEWRVDLVLEPDLITVETNAKVGEAKSKLKCTVKGYTEPVHIRLDTRKVYAAVSSIPGDTVILKLRDGSHPVFFYGEDKQSVEIVSSINPNY